MGSSLLDATGLLEMTVPTFDLTVPKEFLNNNRMLGAVSALSAVGYAVSAFFAIRFSPWWFLPLGWMMASAAFQQVFVPRSSRRSASDQCFFCLQLFVFSEDCSKRQALGISSPFLNDVLGQISLLPLLRPFASLRVQSKCALFFLVGLFRKG